MNNTKEQLVAAKLMTSARFRFDRGPLCHKAELEKYKVRVVTRSLFFQLPATPPILNLGSLLTLYACVQQHFFYAHEPLFHPTRTTPSSTQNMPPTYQRSTRNSRGAGWHRKGYRDRGCMWLNMKRAFHMAAFVRGADFNENETMEELINDLLREFLKSVRRRVSVLTPCRMI